MNTKKAVSSKGTLTNAVDENGILIPLTNREIETLTREQVLDFQERRRQQQDALTAQAREADDQERYTEAFVEAGGDPSDARAAWLAKRKSDAASAADRASTESLEASRRHVSRSL